ncbi:N-acetylmuramic acid-6-phosphate etherase [Raoultella terrigena]|uniref:N-acetylmuramic acid-6-phosphate etherase n=1 Tax=Raoultella terrigena TaxID=577 RepID=A0A4U9CZW3_RAOTE|nr:N-acetylmuramic acid-6-phosphate etherase [Raoultella terrigena]
MLTLLHADGRQIANAIDACLADMTRLVDNAAATLSRGGRLVIVGAGASGRAALQAVSEFCARGETLPGWAHCRRASGGAAGDGNGR